MRRSPCVLAATLAVLLLGGCSGQGGDASSEAGAFAPGVEEVGPAAADAVPEDARQVVTTASTSLVVDDPASAAQQVGELAEAVGGRVDQRSVQTSAAGDGSTVADLVLRVPAPEVTGLLADLGDLGEVQDVSVSRDDVTATAVDLDARISALQTSVARLEALMAGATSTATLLEAEQALSDRQQELESMTSQRASLADQVELSTVTVRLAEVESADADGPDGFLGGLGTGWSALLGTLGAGLVVLGVLLPWLAVAAVVAVLVLVPLRRVRRRTAPAATVDAD